MQFRCISEHNTNFKLGRHAHIAGVAHPIYIYIYILEEREVAWQCATRWSNAQLPKRYARSLQTLWLRKVAYLRACRAGKEKKKDEYMTWANG